MTNVSKTYKKLCCKPKEGFVMKNLVIVESPTKSKTIEKYLGKDFKVTASKGHICDLATRGKGGLGVDVDNNFEPTYIINKDKKEVLEDLKKQVAKADKVNLATDPDREGEAISWHLARELGLDLDDDNRVVFNEITKKAVQEAFTHPRKVDMELVHSQESRRIIDRILGFKLSNLLRKKIYSRSAGRVQSVALKLIVDRQKEIDAFKPEEFWTVVATFEKDGIKFEADLTKKDGQKVELKTEEDSKAMIALSENPFTVTSVDEKVKNKLSPLVFTTSTMQQEASTKLGFQVKRTMRVAQSLYEGIEINGEMTGLITYMRTDSTRVSPEFIMNAKILIESKFGKEYVGYYRQKNDSQSQDAHEGIRPTHLEYAPEDIKTQLSAEQYKLYRFIYYRALAAMMADAKNNVVTATLENDHLEYTANGKQLVFDGYLKAYAEYDSSKDSILPTLVKGEELNTSHVDGLQHFTEPPLAYSEARLVKEMEKNGIGRPSTYADIIDRNIYSGYVTLEKPSSGSKTKVFVPTDKGKLTAQRLDEYFSSMINVEYTSEMEKELDNIAEGNDDYVEYIRTFYNELMPLIENADEKMPKEPLEKYDGVCPDCGGELVIRDGRFGKFISCSNFPKCKYTASIPKPKKILDELCPICGKHLVERTNRYRQKFIGCDGYPDCTYIKKDETVKEKKTTKKKSTRKKISNKKA